MLVYDRDEYDAEANDIVERISEKRKLADKINAGQIKSKPLLTIGKEVKVRERQTDTYTGRERDIHTHWESERETHTGKERERDTHTG